MLHSPPGNMQCGLQFMFAMPNSLLYLCNIAGRTWAASIPCLATHKPQHGLQPLFTRPALNCWSCNVAGRVFTGCITFHSQKLPRHCWLCTVAGRAVTGCATFLLWQHMTWLTFCAQLLVVQYCWESSHWLRYFAFLATHTVAYGLCSQNLPCHHWLCNLAGRAVTGWATFLLWHYTMWPMAKIHITVASLLHVVSELMLTHHGAYNHCSQHLAFDCWLCNVAGRVVTGCATSLLWQRVT